MEYIVISISIFIIFFGMIGYPILLKILSYKYSLIRKKIEYLPTVTIMVVAHNEEKVIKEKMHNLISIDYPKDKLKFMVASDNCSDKTNRIVRDFSNEFNVNIELIETKERKGKTNAQNEAQKFVDTEILVMTDANALFDKNAIKELMSYFVEDDVSYVCGRLVYNNANQNDTSQSESTYWDLDLFMREVESNIQTITAGNGAIYACRNSEYVDFPTIKSHDSSMPLYFALKQKRALFNKNAVAYEKAGESISDEYKRKVRMNRILLSSIIPSYDVFNVFKYKWFSLFYFGHRTCRYLLGVMHVILLITSIIFFNRSIIISLVGLFQILFYAAALIEHFSKTNNKIMRVIYYYVVTIVAQLHGIYNSITGKNKPFWEKAETTR